MRRALVVLAAAAGAAALVLPSAAAPAKGFAYTDAAGDANAINDQGGLLPGVPEQSSPQGQRRAADILSVSYSSAVLAGKPALSVVMKLGGPPDRGTLYRAYSAAPGCTEVVLEFSHDLTAATSGELYHDCGGTEGRVGTTPLVGPDSITWMLPLAQLPPQVRSGTVLTALEAETRGLIGYEPTGALPYSGVIVPVLDVARTAGSYKVGT